MIHFQYDQAGATLRATEVKPKLDKYLLKCAEKESVDQQTLNAWFIQGDSENKKDDKGTSSRKSFNYKMKIAKAGRPNDAEISLDDCKFYFGNQGNGEKKDLVFSNCKLEIVCFIPPLLEFIDRHIGDFFALHNFGTRQTKGFGGFLVRYHDHEGGVRAQSPEEIEKAFQESKQPYFYVDVPNGDKKLIKNRMNHALTIYSIMKNGLNMTRYNEDKGKYAFPARYVKGFVMRPYLDQLDEKGELGSDKAFIKSKILHSKDRDEMDALDCDHKHYTFIRALLGLAEQYEFRDRYRNNGTTTNSRTGRTSYRPARVSIIHCPTNEDGSPKINPEMRPDDVKKLSEIQRFPSPVTIKIFQDRIYFLFNDSYKQILNRTFLFLSFDESIADCLSKKHYLSTPKTFEITAFIESFVLYYNTEAKAKLNSFRDSYTNNPYANSKNLTLKKGW